MNKTFCPPKEREPVVIVVEDRRHAAVLRPVLEGECPQPLRFFAADGKMSVTSLARNILVHEPSCVVVVLDANGIDPLAIQREQAAALESIAPSTRYRILVFTPSLDHIVKEVIGHPANAAIPAEPMETLRRQADIRRLVNIVCHMQGCENASAVG